MRKTLLLLAAVSMAALAACSKKADPSAGRDAAPVAADAAPPTPSGGSADSSPVARTPMLAMAYQLHLALPSDQVRPLMESHQDACERAGPTQCQVIGAQAHTEGKDDETAELDLRATPAWMRAFRGRAEADVRDAGGKVLESGTQGEDLAKPIGDTEAGQKTRAEEEARLKVLLARRSRHLDDSLAIEKEITAVQNDLDAQASALQDMRDRVALQTLSIAYESSSQTAPRGANAPVASAAKAFWGNMMSVFGGLIVLASYLLPFALVGTAGGWLIWRVQRRKPVARPSTGPGEGPALK